MGPIRGHGRRRRAEKRVERAAMAHGHHSGDWWDDFSSRITGHVSLVKGLDKFESVFKMSRKTFNYICSLVREDLMAKSSQFTFTDGRVLTVDDQVAVALRRLSSGDSLLTIGSSFGLNHSTVSQVTWRFVESMEEHGSHHLGWPHTESELATIKSKFEKIRGLSNCCGAIDTTHIMMCLPTMDPTTKVWLDPAKNHSMVLQAIVDPDLKFRDIVTGWPGSMNEFAVLRNSAFFKQCEKGSQLNGERLKLSEGSEVREYIVGDEAFPLLPWLLTPYERKGTTKLKTEYNKRHTATRMVAQRALARLKEMWKIVKGEMWRPDKHRLPRIIFVCCLLHNIIIDLEDEVRDEMPLSHLHDASYRQRWCDFVDKEGFVMREKVAQYMGGRLPS